MKQEYIAADRDALATGATESQIWFHPFCIFTNPSKMRLACLRDFSHLRYVNQELISQNNEKFECTFCKIPDSE